MRSEFAKAVDPIFLAAIDLITRINDNPNQMPVVSDERERFFQLFSRSEAALGNTQEWALAKYALCCWIDSQLIYMAWSGREWWTDNSLERHLYNRGEAHEKFFTQALDADRLAKKDALEVYYLAVVLGFRGFYDEEELVRREHASKLSLPGSIEEWSRKNALALQLRQDRPAFDDSSRKAGSARPLSGRASLINVSIITVFLVALAIGFFLLRLSVTPPKSPASGAVFQSWRHDTLI
jgi:type VI secretion system protein ImpK